MPRRKDTVTRNKARGLLEAHWRPSTVAKKLCISQSTAYEGENRIQMFNSQVDCLEHFQAVSYSYYGIVNKKGQKIGHT